jgi:hypothetical protein
VRSRLSVLVAVVAVAALSSVAIAAVAPKPRTVFFYVSHGHFSITLVRKAATQIQEGRPGSTSVVSDVLIVCPAGGKSSVSELLLGFPGAKLKRTRGHYRFTRSYSWKHPRLNIISGTGAGTHTFLKSANVNVTGTVATAKLITGAVSVKAKGCILPSSHYRAASGALRG